jgi:hypothetical protein
MHEKEGKATYKGLENSKPEAGRHALLSHEYSSQTPIPSSPLVSHTSINNHEVNSAELGSF